MKELHLQCCEQLAVIGLHKQERLFSVRYELRPKHYDLNKKIESDKIWLVNRQDYKVFSNLVVTEKTFIA
jgi:hypothetical protein